MELLILLVAIVLIALVVTGRMDPLHAILCAVAVVVVVLLLGYAGDGSLGNGR